MSDEGTKPQNPIVEPETAATRGTCTCPNDCPVHDGSMIAIRLNTKGRTDLNEDAVAALRLALEGCRDDYKRFGRIVEVILAKAPQTPGNNRGGVNMLIDLHSAGKLKFEVVVL